MLVRSSPTQSPLLRRKPLRGWDPVKVHKRWSWGSSILADAAFRPKEAPDAGLGSDVGRLSRPGEVSGERVPPPPDSWVFGLP